MRLGAKSRASAGMGRWKVIGIVLFVMLAAGALVRFIAHKPGGDKARGSPPVTERSGRLTQLTVPIEGMDCLMCAAGLQAKLRSLPGMRNAEVSYQDKQATVEYDSSVLNRARIEKSIQDAGFKIVHPSLRP